MKNNKPKGHHLKITDLGKCSIQPWGVLSYDINELAFEAYVQIETEQPQIELLYITIKLRLTKKNEDSRLIKIWKEHLRLDKIKRSTLALRICGFANDPIIFACVRPKKIEGRIIHLYTEPNMFGEIWRLDNRSAYEKI